MPAEYELTYLINPQAPEEARGELNNAVDAKVSELAGVADHASPSLRRKLAYPINKNQAAFIRSIHFHIEPEKVDEIRTFLKKTDGLLRFSLVRTPWREDLSPELLEKVKQPESGKGGRGHQRPAQAKEQKKVTMAEVEKGIEEALTEEVK